LPNHVENIRDNAMDDDKLLSKKEVAEMLNCSKETVRRLARDHNLRVIRLNHTVVRYPLSEVRRLIAERTQ